VALSAGGGSGVTNRFPAKLYKYVPAARIDIVENGRIRFTPPSVFNDPFEMRPGLLRVVMASDVATLRLNAAQDLDEDLRIGFAGDHREADSIRAQIGVLSLTTEPRNLLMWSHYADHHRGLVLEFAASHPFFDQRRWKGDDLHYLRRVKYTRDRPQTRIEHFREANVLLTKSVEWRYEREWRMLVDLARYPCNARDEAGQEIHLVALPPECLTGVILGARMPDDTREEVRSFVASDPRYKHLTIQCAELEPDKFDLVVQRGERYLERAQDLVRDAARLIPDAETPWEGPDREMEALLEAALRDVDRALRFGPASFMCWAYRGLAHELLNRLDAAVLDYTHALELAPDSAVPQLTKTRARLLDRLGLTEGKRSAGVSAAGQGR
jgi:tetratricopeptide (TPR) repeat protein